MLAIIFFSTAVAAAAVHISAALPFDSARQQQRLDNLEIMAETEQAKKVYGHNNVTYGPVPKEDQLFYVEILDIGPSPILLYDNVPNPREEAK